MALTASQITRIRLEIGDMNTTDPDLSDDLLNEYWTEAEEVRPVAYVLMLRARKSKNQGLVDVSGDLGGQSLSQKYQHILDTLEMYETQVAQSGGSTLLNIASKGVAFGTFHWGTDADKTNRTPRNNWQLGETSEDS